MDYFDPLADPELALAAVASRHPLSLLSFDTDWRFGVTTPLS